MHGVLFADRAIFAEFETIGIVTFILVAIVISVFALGAFKRNLLSRRFGSHWLKLHTKKLHPLGAYENSNTIGQVCQLFLHAN